MATDPLTAGGGPGGHLATEYTAPTDYPAHVATYRFFTGLIKWGTTFVVFALLLLAFLTL